MAILPQEPNGPQWQITDINNLVFLIENPGLDNERVHFQWDLTNSMGVSKAIQEATTYGALLTKAQTEMLVFWLGYFYAHFSRR